MWNLKQIHEKAPKFNKFENEQFLYVELRNVPSSLILKILLIVNSQ